MGGDDKNTWQRCWVSDSKEVKLNICLELKRAVNPHQGAGLDQRPVFLPHVSPEKDS